MKLIKKLFLLTFFTFCSQITFSQKQASNWYFGSNVGLNFNTGPSTVTTTGLGLGDDNEGEGFSTVSDDNGNLLFHTNGENIWDKNLAIMQNGSGLGGHYSATQCATVFPVPGQTVSSNKARYVVVTSPFSQEYSTAGKTGIRYSIVTMDSAAYPTGAVTNVKNILMNGSPVNMSEALSSCPHYDGTSVWVIGHTKRDGNNTNGDRFYAWKITANGTGNITVSAPVISTIGNILAAQNWQTSAGIAVLKINSCFNKIALTNYASAITQVFSFNNNTGVVGNYPAPVNAVLQLNFSKTIAGNTGDTGQNYGLEFSPNGRYLFATQTGEGTNKKRIYRFDLLAGTQSQTDIENSRYTVYSDDADNSYNHRLGHLQLGIDGKIYATHFYRTIATGTARVDVINTPNDASPGYSPSVYTWPNTYRTSMGLPTFHKGFLAGFTNLSATDSTSGTAISDLGEICQGIATILESKYTNTGTDYVWDVDYPNGVLPNYGTSVDGSKAYHRYTTPGEHTVVIKLKDAECGYIVSDTATITVNPVINTNADYSCSSPNVTMSVVPANPAKKYVWYKDAALTQVAGYGSPLVLPADNVSYYNYYVKEVNDITVTNNYPGIIGSTSTTGTTANTASNTITLSQSAKLISVNVQIADLWNNGTANYVITLKDASNLTVFSVTTPLPVNSPRTVTIPIGATLAAGTYTLTYSQVNSTSNYLVRKSSLTNQTSLPGVALVGFSGESPFSNFVFEYTKTDITQLACSNPFLLQLTCALPVTFLNVSVNENRLVSWSTATETNNSFFVVERSYNATDFEAIGTVKGAGNSTTVRNYNFHDKENYASAAYYRIKQVDSDGQYSYSAVVYIGMSQDFNVLVYPNPNNGLFTISISSELTSNVEVMNILGNVVYSSNVTDGNTNISVDLSNLSKGAYFLKVSNGTKSYTSKLIIN